jgi:hypothetical protein
MTKFKHMAIGAFALMSGAPAKPRKHKTTILYRLWQR